MGLFQNHMMAAAVAATAETAYSVDNSLRLNSGSTPYMSKTFAGAGNRKTWTFSCWLKLSRMKTGDGNYAGLFRQALHYVGFRQTAALGRSHFNLSGVFSAFGGGALTDLHRDPSAWYHFVFIFDTTQAVATNRIKFYVNNTLLTLTTEGGTPPSLNYDGPWLNNAAHELFRASSADAYILDGYVAEVIVCDGTALPPSNFGETNTQGVWVPKKISGLTFGTNGFYLDFQSSGDLGNDVSGNNNDWGLTNIDSTNQSTDTPTNNKITFNPLSNQRGGGTLTQGNTVYSGPGTRTMVPLTANIPSTGKWAVAFSTDDVSTGNGWNFGITKSNNSNFGDAAGSNEDVGASDGINMNPSGSVLYLWNYIAGSGIEPGQAITTSDEFWLAVDMATGKCFLGIYDDSASAMVWVAADAGLDGNPADGSNPSATISDMIGSTDYTFAVAAKSPDLTLIRSADLDGTIPTGYTYFENVSDLPAPDVKDPSASFQIVTFLGNGADNREIDQTGNSTFQPDLLLTRATASSHPGFFDAARGVKKYLKASTADAEGTSSVNKDIDSFDSDGYTVSSSQGIDTNTGSYTEVGWMWKAGNSGASNTTGTINTTTTYSDATAGISISTYTGTGSAATIGHGLGVAPKLIMIKNRTAADSWKVYHEGVASDAQTDYLVLDTDVAAVDDATVWNDTAPTSTVFSIGTHTDVNTNTETYLAYVFAEVAGFSKFGVFTGNGNADGVYNVCGFQPAFIIVKPSSRADGWVMWDTTRDTSNLTDLYMTLDTNNAQFTGTVRIIDITSNGFKMKGSHNSVNGSGDTYVYIAFAESPFGGDGVAPATAH